MPVYLFTQNMLDRPEARKNVSHTPDKELEEFLKATLPTKQKIVGANNFEGEHFIFLGPDTPKLSAEERCTLKISAKVFLSSPDKEMVYKALNDTLQSLDLDHFDSAVFAWPFKKEELLAAWPYAENLIDDKVASSLGVSDVETQTFIDLHSNARLKPEIVQINLEACCVVPPELASFARGNDIQLLTHNDPKEMLPKARLDEIAEATGCGWLKQLNVEWITRYQALVKCRGILKTKGYVIKLVK